VGTKEGRAVGVLVGAWVGRVVGCAEGRAVGLKVGLDEGLTVGNALGLCDVGALDGLKVGADTGFAVGRTEGLPASVVFSPAWCSIPVCWVKKRCVEGGESLLGGDHFIEYCPFPEYYIESNGLTPELKACICCVVFQIVRVSKRLAVRALIRRSCFYLGILEIYEKDSMR
jgi:hypothetical protein